MIETTDKLKSLAKIRKKRPDNEGTDWVLVCRLLFWVMLFIAIAQNLLLVGGVIQYTLGYRIVHSITQALMAVGILGTIYFDTRHKIREVMRYRKRSNLGKLVTGPYSYWLQLAITGGLIASSILNYK